MQKVTIICVGKLKEKFYVAAAAEYVKRLQRFCDLDIVELPECRLSENPSSSEIEKALASEGRLISDKIPHGSTVAALCIEGKPCSSESLASRLQEIAVSSRPHVTFLIGGSLGLDKNLKSRCDWRLSMSPMTFPHHMARVMLLEQIYRAYQIQSGTKYHK